MIQFEKIDNNILVVGSKTWSGEEFTGPKFVQPEAFMAITSSKLCKFVKNILLTFEQHCWIVDVLF